MIRKEQIWWASLTILSLAAFSFFAGLGLRGLISRLSDTPESARADYPRLASAVPQVPDTNLRPGQLYNDVLQKLKVYYVEPLPPKTELAYGSIEFMLNE